jgi:hypothetical protein
MARDNSRVEQAFLIIAREHSRCSARWERTLSRRLAIAIAAAGSCKGFSTYSARTKRSLPVNGKVYQLNIKSTH